ncbi:VTT domain-containing protein [Halobacillus sp. ACCC02827]|uniref:TVP38/TMEM64 family protein n=1 Tax=Bacillaceae TaxID=186817 RepID=UPI00042A5E8A|nr:MULTISPECIES: VTT domain-containing protein [Bacillaceae]QHT45358.1 TVP38/TMEM64 family protein [Bacillus sp. SB49]WJE16143.1 VTT domain-containing protein [Halobacillus sp. ACCC02827]
MSRKSIGRALVVLTVFLFAVFIVRSQLNVSPDHIRSYILSFGAWGPALFILLYAAGPIIVFPTSILSLAAAFAYGLWPGILYIIIGATAASITGYAMGRFFGDSVLKFEESKWAAAVYPRMKRQGFLYVFILRLIPLVGFDILSYLAGMTRVRLSAFLLATVIGMLPGSFAYSLVGTSLASGNRSLIIAAFSVFAFVLVLTFLFRNKVKEWLKIR